MNRLLTSLLVMVLLTLLVVSPFSALAMLMMVMFASGVIWFISTIVQVIIKGAPETSKTDSQLEADS